MLVIRPIRATRCWERPSSAVGAAGTGQDVRFESYQLLPIFLFSSALILAASEIARRLGVRARSRGGENVTPLEGAILGLLALMIGFTFAMALSRFEAVAMPC